MVEFDFKPANDTYADPHTPSVMLGLMLGDEGKGMTVAKETQRRIEAGLSPAQGLERKRAAAEQLRPHGQPREKAFLGTA